MATKFEIESGGQVLLALPEDLFYENTGHFAILYLVHALLDQFSRVDAAVVGKVF